MREGDLNSAEAYRRMLTIRRLEEAALELSASGEVAGSIHPCIGQEAIPVGAVAALHDSDRIMSTYRGHGWALAAGSSPEGVLGEIAQRAGGVNGGRAGSPLMSDPANGFLGENSIVGAGVPIAGGVGLAAKLQGTGRVVTVSIGDGAMNQGATNEGLVFAATNRLPVIFIVENNGWAEMTPVAATTSGDLVERGRVYGIESHIVDGCDPFAVRDAVAAAAAACRDGNGPVLLECKTVRLRGHYNRDIQHYRPKDDLDAAIAADPLPRLIMQATQDGTLTAERVAEIDDEVAAAITRTVATVRAMPLPTAESALDHLYATDDPVLEPASMAVPESTQEMTYQRAVNLALKTELRERPETIVYGEDVGFAGGIFGVSRGLQKEFGPSRVFDTPIAEAAILGSAVGAALEGMRPIVEIMWADFVFVALDQIVNQAANVRYVSSSILTAPLTIRMQQGVTPGSCAQHSQSIEAILAHIPGIKVGLPSTAHDAYHMLRAAVADPDPTIIIEHRSLYQVKDEVRSTPPERAEGARFRRRGGDVAIITWGQVTDEVIEAAEVLSNEGIEATVVDLRWIRPLDHEAIAVAVADADGRVLVVHEASTFAGFGAEVSASITERHFDVLRAPVARIGTPDIRIPSAPSLQDAVLPRVDKIVATAVSLARRTRSSDATSSTTLR